jgi:hypothetical protein
MTNVRTLSSSILNDLDSIIPERITPVEPIPDEPVTTEEEDRGSDAE